MWLTPLFPHPVSGSRRRRNLTSRRGSPSPRRSTRPRLEVLEVRALLSIFTVTDNSDDPKDTGSLRWAVDNVANNTIRFAPNVTNIVLDPLNAYLHISTNLDIEGPGPNVLTITGNNGFAVFQIDSNIVSAISGLTMSGGNVRAVENDGTLTMTNCAVVGNFSGVTNYAALTMTNCTLANNSATSGNGGAIDNYGAVTMTNCTLSGNSAANGNGGGIDNESGGSLTMTNCTLADNSASGNGGGIVSMGPLQMTNCALTGNSAATGNGGGIDFEIGAFDYLTNCTVAGNSASAGGGLADEIGGVATLTNCTIAGNSAGTNEGGGVANFGTVNLGNTIIAGNNAPISGSPDVYGTVVSFGYNLIGNPTGASGFAITDLLYVNPLLGPLQHNGGPTQTMALLPGSRAINAGRNSLIPSGVTTDQRGFARIVNGTVDIGAFESRGFTIAITSGNAQSTTVNTGFLNPLVATVSSPYGDPVAGGVVTFTGPLPFGGAGATFAGGTGFYATVTIDPTGQAAVSVAANTVAGSYSVTANTGGESFSAGLILTNAPGAAAAITATAGTPQSTTVGYAFASPLQVLVTDVYGNPVPGVSVTFAAPTTGASGGFSAGAVVATSVQGIAAPTFNANTKAGVYVVTASVNGVTTPATFSLTNTPDVASSLLVSPPATVTAGTQLSFTVTAQDRYGNTATSYRGTVHFASSDRKAILPADYPFVSGDNGVHTFVATLNTAGSETITASDTGTLSLTSTAPVTAFPKSGQSSLTVPRSSSLVLPAADGGISQVRRRHRANRRVVIDTHHSVRPLVHDRARQLFSREPSGRRKG
jgi:hypothetical protein